MGPPVDAVKYLAKVQVVVQTGIFKLVANVLQGIEQHNPALLLAYVFVPLLVVTVVIAVKIEHMLADENKLIDALPHQGVYDVALEVHDIVVEAIVPFAYQLKDGVVFLVIGKQQLAVQSAGTKRIPLRMNVVVVNLMREVGLAVASAIKRRPSVFGRSILFAPIVVWFDVVHERIWLK